MTAWRDLSIQRRLLIVVFTLFGGIAVASTIAAWVEGRLFLSPGLLFALLAYGLYRADSRGRVIARVVASFYLLMIAFVAGVSMIGALGIGEMRIASGRVDIPFLGISESLQTTPGIIMGVLVAGVIVGVCVWTLSLTRRKPRTWKQPQ